MYLLFIWKFYPFVLANVHMALSKSLYLTAFLFSLLNVLVLFFKPMLQIPVFQCDFFGIQRNQIIFKMHVYGCLPINTSKLPKNIDLNTMELNRSLEYLRKYIDVVFEISVDAFLSFQIDKGLRRNWAAWDLVYRAVNLYLLAVLICY